MALLCSQTAYRLLFWGGGDWSNRTEVVVQEVVPREPLSPNSAAVTVPGSKRGQCRAARGCGRRLDGPLLGSLGAIGLAVTFSRGLWRQ